MVSTGGAGPGPSCRCGHDRAAHRHYRAGSDCGLCGCPRFRPAPAALVRRLLARAGRPRRGRPGRQP